ncbi:MAG: hypothetical protein HRT88_20255 [Lentisphaeraceae bacterium]|nr:hypothetical protein [Lentisphaeraceae bacterium]
MLLASATIGTAQAGLFDPVLLNPSFEEQVLSAGTNSGGITNWFDSVNYTFTVNDNAGSGTHPDTAYGDNWAELGTQRWIYQQIGTYEENMNLDV